MAHGGFDSAASRAYFEIQVLEVNVPQSSRNEFLFRISVGSVDEAGSSNEGLIEIQAKDFHLEDPAKPGEIISS